MSFEEIFLLNILSRMYKPEGGGNGGGNGRGCGCGCAILIFAVIITFFLESAANHKIACVIILISIIVIFFVLPKINDYLCELMDRYIYKDEPPEVRKERLETEKLIREWQKRKFF